MNSNHEEVYQEAIELLNIFKQEMNGYISIPVLQRRLKLGHRQASDIMKKLEHEGYVSAFLADSPRKINNPIIRQG